MYVQERLAYIGRLSKEEKGCIGRIQRGKAGTGRRCWLLGGGSASVARWRAAVEGGAEGDRQVAGTRASEETAAEMGASLLFPFLLFT